MSDALREHFFVMVGTVCENARIAQLPVRVMTRDGNQSAGVPQPQSAEEAAPDHEVDHTGFARELLIGDEVVALDSVVELTFSLPDDGIANARTRPTRSEPTRPERSMGAWPGELNALKARSQSLRAPSGGVKPLS